MCGIAGFVAAGPAFGERELEAMAGALAHRGPDGSGRRVYDLPDGRRVGLAHARLALVDLSPAGAQPMERGDLSLVLNGEIYDFARQRERLEREGRPFRTRSDAEVLLALWEEGGPRALREVVGTFALALLDRRRGDLLLARDPVGKKPLLYARVPGALVFASELRALERFPGFRREVDPAALREYLIFGYVPAPRTIYAGARKLLPGGRLRVGSGGEESGVEALPDAPRVDGEEGEIEELLRDAVRLRLAADAPVGVFLSGGIDSSLVAALAAESRGGRLRTFALALPGSPLDESSQAARVARALGAEHEEVPFRASDFEGWIERLPELLDEPLADASLVPTAALARAARRSAKAVLTGDGGDELFAGYDRYRGIRALARISGWPEGLRRAAAFALERAGGLFPAPAAGTSRRAGRFAEAIRSPGGSQAYRSLVGLFPPAEVEALLGSAAEGEGGGEAFARAYEEGAGGDPAVRAMRADLRTYLVDDLLAKVDRATMAFGLEARCPLLDRRVVALAQRLPLASKLRGRRSKVCLRRLLARRFPPGWFSGRKRGFAIPLAAWLGPAFARGPRRFLDPETLAGAGGMSPAPVARWLREFRSGRADRAARLWALLLLARWRERTGASLPGPLGTSI
ncbi:MAG TPA: asparagine synthase (glutamine-hydrolyzing) [Planctomycetota bacterium]|jgi:asparagine synthase (glutamine-hydrolysing)|nr:asparagine synthase (glutamine-hydrolyzing) [Planctomycetota bacterium]